MSNMTNRKCLVVRLTKNQHERLRSNAEAKGYKTLSSYVRAVTLEHDLSLQKKLDEIYSKMMESEEKEKEKLLAQ